MAEQQRTGDGPMTAERATVEYMLVRNLNKIADRLESQAARVRAAADRLEAGEVPNRATPYSATAASVVHEIAGTLGNFSFDSLITSAAEADAYRAKGE